MNDRKLKILAAVIDEYIMTGEPVGSKAIASLPEINVSAATVRNDMAMLEQLGYLEQPHTSAGRVPTFSGYRLYIDKIMKTQTLPDDEVKRLDKMLEDQGASYRRTRNTKRRYCSCRAYAVCGGRFKRRSEIFGNFKS